MNDSIGINFGLHTISRVLWDMLWFIFIPELIISIDFKDRSIFFWLFIRKTLYLFSVDVTSTWAVVVSLCSAFLDVWPCRLKSVPVGAWLDSFAVVWCGLFSSLCWWNRLKLKKKSFYLSSNLTCFFRTFGLFSVFLTLSVVGVLSTGDFGISLFLIKKNMWKLIIIFELIFFKFIFTHSTFHARLHYLSFQRDSLRRIFL